MTRLKIVLVVLILVLLVVLVIQNADTVTIRFLIWRFDVSNAVVIGVAFVAGLACGILLGHRWTRRIKQK